MRLLEEYIKKYGNALNEDVLKVDAFLNHQIDAQLMMELAKDFKEHFKDKHITKIATIETSGIAPAVMLGYLLQVPVVYFKKDTSRIMKDDLYTCQIHSFTKNGEACLGGIEILKQANAFIEGIGIVIEKAFQRGRLKVEAQGYPVYSQARIASLSQGTITFVSEEYEVA